MYARFPIAAFLSAWFVASSTLAAAPQLNELVPQGAQRGTEITVLLRGLRLGDNPQEILWHEPGIQVKHIERVDENQAQVTLNIPPALPPGRYAMRLRTATGISNVMTFHVGSLPEIAEVEPNSNPLEAQQIQLGTAVNGLVQSEDVDYFSFEAQAGEVIAAEVEGLRMGRTFFDPVLTLFDAEGNEIAQCDDWPLIRQDACFTVAAPHDGNFLLELRETAYRGDNQATYRLHVGKFPRPLAVYPPGGRIGDTINIQWLGDAGGNASEVVELPPKPTEAFNYVPSCERGTAPSPHLLRVVDMPVSGEAEPNNVPAEATAAEAPGAFHGILDKTGDRDHFRFAAKKGQVLHLRLHARSIGSPVDAILRVLDANGKNLAGNDDDRGHPDSYIRFQAPADGEYIAQIEDCLKRGGETFTYWLEANPAEPSVALELEEQQRYVAKLFDVPRGNRNGAIIVATRRDTSGDLAIEWSGLPAGVSAELFPLPGNYNRVPVVLSAAADAPLGQGLATMAARRVEDNSHVATAFTQRNWMIRGQNNVDMWNYSGSRAVVAVTEEAPFAIRLEEPKAPLVQRGSKNLRVVAERAEGFNGAILVRMLYNPPGVSANNSLRIKQGETEVAIPITANERATLGDWKIVMRGEAEVRGALVTVTPFATLKIAAPYVTMTLPKPSVEQGKSVSFPIAVEHHTPFKGEAKVELLGLPPGVTVEPLSITSETKEFAFQLDVAADARPGQHGGLFCRVTIQENGEPVVHSVGAGGLRIDQPVRPAADVQASR